MARTLWHTLYEGGGDPDPPPPPKPLRNISPNQFALPGMEHQAHPLARHLPSGVHFDFTTDYTHGEGGRGQRQPYGHTLSARHLAKGPRPTLGYLSWAGSGSERRGQQGHYPGEITYVQRGSSSPRMAKKTKGLLTDMFHATHQMNMGQSTVAVHSPERTAHGEQWANQTDYQHLVPERYDTDWRPPAGIHPYERRNLSQHQFQRPPEGQQHLPGMSRADDIWWDVK